MRLGFIYLLGLMLLTLHVQPVAAAPQFTALAQQNANAPLVSYDVNQDPDGFIWFASERDGLQRFDGYELVNWPVLTTQEQNKTTANVNQLLFDSQQHLWVSTWGQGVTQFDHSNTILHRFHSEAAPKLRLPSDQVQSLFEDKQQRVWLGTVKGLHYVELGTSDTVRQLAGTEHLRVWQMTQSDDGALWLATSDGLVQISADLKHLKRWPLPQPSPQDGRSFNDEIRSLLMIKTGLWLGSSHGLFFFHFSTGEIASQHSAEMGKINTLLNPAPDQLWVGTSTGFYLMNIDPSLQTKPDYFLPSADVRRLFQDATGMVWVATRNRGIFKVNPLPQSFTLYPLPQSSKVAEQKMERIYNQTLLDNRIWLGLDRDIVSYDLTKKTWQHHKVESGRVRNQIPAITKDYRGRYWAGTEAGLLQAATKDSPFRQVDLPETLKNITSIKALSAEPDGSLWIGLWEKGVIKWPQQNSAGELEHYDIATLPGDAVVSILNDPHSDSVWFVSRYSGAYQLQRSTGQITRYHSGDNSPIPLPTDTLVCMAKVTESQFWFCTDQGLFFMDLVTKETKLYQVQQGLPDNRIIAINTEQPGQIWISTKRGLAVLNLQDQDFKTFAEKDNINSLLLENRALSRTDDGHFWLGTAEGLYQFTPNKLDNNKLDAPMVISQISANQQYWYTPRSSELQPLQFAATTKEISISFSFLEYYFMEGHQYQYRLLGSNPEWHYIGHQHQLSFTHLPAGHYNFEVRNSLSTTDENTASFHFVIAAPLWQDKRIWLFIGLLVLLSLWLIWQLRVRHLQQQNVRLNALVKERTLALEQANQALSQQARTDFLTKLPNRLAFSEQFELMQRQAIRQKIPFTLVLLDIDHFKAINDTYGHDAGDVVLAKVAQSLSQRLRQCDVLARWGGEEFILLLPETSIQGAKVISEELRLCLMQMNTLYGNHQIAITATLGIAQLDDLQLELIRWQSAADSALYQGKKTGRNKVVVYQNGADVQDHK